MKEAPALPSPLRAARLGVILCNYNDAPTLPRALDAILGQSRPPDEIVLVDDGSTDDSREILARYAARNPSVRVLLNDRNRGLFYSTRRALEASTAEYIYSASANDYILPGFFARAVDLINQHRDVFLCFGCVVYKDQATGAETRLEVKNWAASGFRSAGDFLHDYLDGGELWASLGPSCIFRRQALLDAGGFLEDLDAFCDTFVSSLLGLQRGVCYLHEPCTVYFTGGEAFSHKLYRDSPRLVTIIHRAALRMRAHPQAFPSDYVERWKHTRLESVLAGQCSQFRSHVWQARTLVEATAPGRQRISRLLLRVLSSCLIRLGEAHIRRAGLAYRAHPD